VFRGWGGLGLGLAMLAVLAGPPLATQALDVPRPQPTDVCPICGMFVIKYPEWVATLVYRDGFVAHFDGVKDLFKYLFDLPKYAPGRNLEDIVALVVTDYYGLTRIDAREAWFVIGSDVLGPMGHELVPLATAADAEEFMSDHRGTQVLRFDDVNPQIVQRLDASSPASR
jgi:copper chaperone NosL